MKSEYISLKLVDFYGERFYSPVDEGNDVNELRATRLAFYEKQQVHVQWPNKSETIETIKLYTHLGQFSEQGIGPVYRRSLLPMIVKEIHGHMAHIKNLEGLLFLASDLQYFYPQRRTTK